MWPFKKKSADVALREFVERLTRALDRELVSVLLFGSKASGEFRDDSSDVNVFLLVRHLSWDILERMSPAVQAWKKAGHPAPVFVQESELQTYANNLPIEFLDMRDHHTVIFGSDPIQALTIDRTHLRAQCAQELAIKLLKIRQAVMLVQGKPKRLRDILLDTVPSVLTLCRAVLRLESDVPKGLKIEAAEALAAKAGFDLQALEKLADIHMRRQTDNIEDLAQRYLEVIERVLAYASRS